MGEAQAVGQDTHYFSEDDDELLRIQTPCVVGQIAAGTEGLETPRSNERQSDAGTTHSDNVKEASRRCPGPFFIDRRRTQQERGRAG